MCETYTQKTVKYRWEIWKDLNACRVMPRLSPSQSWIQSPNMQQSHSSDPGLWWRKVHFIARSTKENGQLSSCSKGTNSPTAFREGILQTVWGGGSQGMHNSLMGCWWSVGNLNHQPFSSRLSGVSVLMVSLQLTSSTCVSTWGHVSEYFPQPLRGSLDFDCYCFFLLDSLPLFLHFLTSLIKFALQNSGEA